MDVSAVIVVIVMTTLSLAAIVGLEIYSRKSNRKGATSEKATSDVED
jgi:hypothetical protein